MLAPPPSLSDLPAGYKLRAGLGVSTVMADMDFETYSEAGYVWDASESRWRGPPRAPAAKRGLSVVGMARYAEHPTTEVLCLAYDLKDGRGRRQWLPGQPPPVDLFAHLRSGGPIEAHKAGFERHVWEQVCVKRMGWPPIQPEQWRCSMAKARAHALPGALAQITAVLGTSAQKDPVGKRLIQKFSVPRNPTKKDPRLRLDPATDPEGPLFYKYNIGDVAAESEASSLTPDLPPEEQEYWHVDQAINHRGVAIDVDGVRSCIQVVEAALARYNGELALLTGGIQASQVAQLTGWLHGRGVHLDSLDEEHVEAALGRLPPQPPGVIWPPRRALEIRALAGSASVKKLFAMENQVCADGRLRDLFNYHAARTGRPTGEGPQPTNLPSSGPEMRRCEACRRHYGKRKPMCPWCWSDAVHSKDVEWGFEAAEDARRVLATGNMDTVLWHFDEVLPVIAGCLRGLFVARPGYDLVCSDFNSIEAVGGAEITGETWRQEVFRTHGKIYEMSAALITGVSFDEMMAYRKETGSHHPHRKRGKVMELACGFGGWVGAMKNFGAGEFMTEAEMADAAGKWRRASPAFVECWGGQTRRGPYGSSMPELFGIEGAALRALYRPGEVHGYRGRTFVCQGDVLYLRLLSGRYLTYHRPRLRPSERRAGEVTISYEGWNTNPKNGPVGWIRMDTYGPKIFENITQAECRDIQRHAQVQLERAGYPIVLHVYDENVAEVPEEFGSVEEVERIMSSMPAWAADWPVRASGGWRGKRYRKD